MVAHRGNLNYQDCRRTLTAGFEPGEVDVLREVDAAASEVIATPGAGDQLEPVAQSLAVGSSSVAQSLAFTFESKSKQERVRFRVKITSAGILASEFWKVLGLRWVGSLEVSDQAQRRASQFWPDT